MLKQVIYGFLALGLEPHPLLNETMSINHRFSSKSNLQVQGHILLYLFLASLFAPGLMHLHRGRNVGQCLQGCAQGCVCPTCARAGTPAHPMLGVSPPAQLALRVHSEGSSPPPVL